MSVLVEPGQAEAPPAPDAGLIRDARSRQMRRRRRYAAAMTAVAALGTVIAWFPGGSGSRSTSPSDARRNLLAFEHAKQRRMLSGWHISPALEGGDYGWCVLEGGGGGTCATVPTQNTRTLSGVVTIGAVIGTNITRREERITALLAPDVRGVLANGRSTTVVTKAQLPYGLRIAQIDFAREIPTTTGHSVGSATSVGPPGQKTFATPAPRPTAPPPVREGATPTLLATAANGKPLAYFNPEPASRASIGVRWWARPEPLAPGPCQIGAHGLAALEPEWGHVAATIRPYPAKIIGRAFFSCADSEYYLHNWPLETAILLDAQHPGVPPASIPGMKPAPHLRGVFNAPGDWHGEITATRHGNAWLVVAGGSGLKQRIEVLRHLTATVSLRLANASS
jgi:hypothetical protein